MPDQLPPDSLAARIARFVTQKNRLVLLLLGVAVVAAGSSLGALRFDSSVEHLTDKTAPDWQRLEEARRVFGSDDVIVVAQRGEGHAVQTGRMQRLAQLGVRIEAIPGVERVWSITGSGHIRGADGAIEVLDLAAQLPQTAEESAALATRLENSPLYRDHLLSRDGTTPVLLVFPRPSLSAADSDAMVDAIRATLDTAAGPERLVMTGNPSFTTAVGRTMQAEQDAFTGITLALLALVLAMAFGRPAAVVLPLLGAGAAVAIVIGTMTHLGGSLSVLSTIVPSLVLALGITYAMHFLVRAFGAPGQASAERSLRAILLPTALSVLTTVVGFLAVASSRIEAIREFGLLSAAAVAVVGITALLVPAAGFSLLRSKRLRLEPPGGEFVTRRLRTCRRLAGEYGGTILAVTAVLALATAAGIGRIEVNTNFVDYLDAEHPANQERLEVLEHVAGPIPLRLSIDTGTPGGILEPDVLARMRAFQDWVTTLPGAEASFAITDLLAEMHLAFDEADGLAGTRALPRTRGMAAQFLLLYESGEFGQDLDRLLSPERDRATIWVRTDVYDSGSAREIVAAIENWSDTNLAGLDPQLSGTLFSLLRSSDEIAAGQIRSLAIALFAIVLVLMAVLRSPRMGAIAAAPNLLPVLIIFGAMGWSGVPLNLGTAVVACLSLGVATDDTIHFVVTWREQAARGLSAEEALARTFALVGRPIALTSVALMVAFASLGFSSFGPVRDLGWLTALTMASCLVADLLLLPALLLRFGGLRAPQIEARAHAHARSAGA